MRLWMAVAMALGGVAVAAWVFPPLRLAGLVLAGRSPECPFGQALRSEENLRQQTAIKDRLLAGSRRVQTDAAGYEQWETPKGRYWIPAGSQYVLPFNLAEQERKIYGAPPHFVRPGDIVLDCGANVGVFVREALNAGARLVVAIEPAPENVECLRRNFAKEVTDGRVIVYPKGVWDREEWLPLRIDRHNSAADSFVMHPEGAQETTEKLPLTTIDQLVSELKLPRVDFIKMDIEGAEPRALRGARSTLARFHPRISVSAYHAPDHPSLLPAIVREAWKDYRVECGPCALTPEKRIRPDILYFH
jgi:FkbM family methyltransferase